MFKSCLILDLPMNATDEEIRKRYLDLVKQFPPEKHPEKFHQITAAYESIKNRRSRVQSRLFTTIKDVDTETALKDLIASAKLKRKNAGLKTLLNAAGISK